MSLVLTGTSGASNLDSTNGLQFATWTTSTRPASPIAGQMGYNTTTNAFDAYVNGAWVSIATSSTAPTAGPTFSAYTIAATGTTIGTGATKVTYDTKEFDTNTNFSLSTNRFTPTVAGYYQINAQIQPSSAYCGGFIGVYKNGSVYKYGSYSNITNALGGFIVSTLVPFNGTTDYIEIYAAFTVSQALNGGIQFSYVNGTLVRPT